jgi:hypothetical protein
MDIRTNAKESIPLRYIVPAFYLIPNSPPCVFGSIHMKGVMHHVTNYVHTEVF